MDEGGHTQTDVDWSEARDTDRLTDGLTLFFSPCPAQCYPSIQCCAGKQSWFLHPFPDSPDKVRAHPLVGPASSIIQPEREATCAQSPGRAGSLGDIWDLWWDGGVLAFMQLCTHRGIDGKTVTQVWSTRDDVLYRRVDKNKSINPILLPHFSPFPRMRHAASHLILA